MTMLLKTVIPGSLLASAYPGSKNSTTHKMIVNKMIIDASIETIVNLMETHELRRFTPYEQPMMDIANTLNRKLEFISFPIKDGNIVEDDASVSAFCSNLCERLKRGEKMLIHCWGGHGRTGTIVSILIGMLFHMSGDEALKLNSALHDQRVRTNGISSPEASCQWEQVRRILKQN